MPIAIKVTPANRNDATQAIPLMDAIKSQPKYYCMDMGYDTKDIYQAARSRKSQAIIPLNRQKEKLPPEGMDENHTPTCSMGYPMDFVAPMSAGRSIVLTEVLGVHSPIMVW